MDEAQMESESIRQFEVMTGIEVIVHGDVSRLRLAQRIIQQWEAISVRAVRLLEGFMRDRGEFYLGSIKVFAVKDADGGDFLFWYNFSADRDPHEYNYTYFEVYFSCHEPPSEPFWPYKFTVGFY